MKIASFLPRSGRAAGASDLMSPVHALMAYFLPTLTTSARARHGVNPTLCHHTSALAHQAPKPTNSTYSAHPSYTSYPNRIKKNPYVAPTQRLKVVRQFEPGASRSCAGRLVISGRMSEVCAELERMAG